MYICSLEKESVLGTNKQKRNSCHFSVISVTKFCFSSSFCRIFKAVEGIKVKLNESLGVLQSGLFIVYTFFHEEGLFSNLLFFCRVTWAPVVSMDLLDKTVKK